MYTLGVKDSLIASHFLLGEDVGHEGVLHSHLYKLEMIFKGKELDSDGYLLDILKVQEGLALTTSYFKDKSLNELDEFSGLNPSIEHFARIYLEQFLKKVSLSKNIEAIEIKIWEDDIGYVTYSKEG